MATAKVTPFVVSAQPAHAVESITQLELELLLSLRNRSEQLKMQIVAEEETLKLRLESGATIEPGVHIAELKESFRRNIAWKSVVVRLADRLKLNGETYCARVLAATKPDRSASLIVN